MDGGLIYGYREKAGKRQLWYDGTVGLDWMDVDSLQSHAVYVLVKKGEPQPRDAMLRESLARAVAKASPHNWKGVPQGLSALEAYLADVENPQKDFEKCGEYFCWATFERLSSRRCCATWLARLADLLGGEAKAPLVAAAKHYEEAFGLYEEFRKATLSGEETNLKLRERARTPERIKVIAPILRAGIEAERKGLEEMKKALETLGGDI
jgi:hypothetical protein